MLPHNPSPDGRIVALAAKRARLVEEAARLDQVLDAYALAPSRLPTFAEPAVSLLRHYAMTDKSLCGCGVCAEWRQRRGELVSALRFVPEGHRWSVCACRDCRFAGRIQLNYVAASNVRDLLIEVSYHANFHSRHGDRVMRWLEGELSLPRYTVDWCAYELGRRPVDEWLTLCERALSPVVSGIVFTPGDGEPDEPVAFRLPPPPAVVPAYVAA